MADELAKQTGGQLAAAGATLVLAESCTAGLVAARLGTVPGISQHLCGSFVTYQEASKTQWLGVSADLLAEHTAASPQVTRAMALAALQRTAHAQWSAAVTGHLGPDAPSALDGICMVAIARRLGDKLELCQERRYALVSTERTERQAEAASAVLELVSETLRNRE